MRKSEIVEGGRYKAKVSNRIVTVRVDAITEQTTWLGKACTTYRVTNLSTNRETTFRSAAKFRSVVN